MTNYNPEVIFLSETHSTSGYLSTLLQQPLKEFTVVYTGYQSAGKGQRGNYWESESGKNLLFSMVVYPEFLEIPKQFLLSKTVALAIKEELDLFAEGFSIKWPNDIYWKEQKICGILIENMLQHSSITSSILGIGININQEFFLSDAPNPVSLHHITGEVYDLPVLLSRFIQRIIHYYMQLKQGASEAIELRYRKALFRREGLHRYADKNGEFSARIVEVKACGALILEDECGKRREYLFKEVSPVIDCRNS